MSRARFLLLPLFAILLVLGACQSEGKLEGEVFIVTEGRENIEMGLVEVRAIEASTLDKQLDKRFSTSQKKVNAVAERASVVMDSVVIAKNIVSQRRKKYREEKSSLRSLRAEYGDAKSAVSMPVIALSDAITARVEEGPSKGDEVATYDEVNLLENFRAKNKKVIKSIESGVFGTITNTDSDYDYYEVNFPNSQGWVKALNVVPSEKYKKYRKQNEAAKRSKGNLSSRLERIQDSVELARRRFDNAQGNRSRLANRVRVLFDSIETYRNQRFFFSDLPSPVDSDETGSDGNYKLTVESGVPHYLVAEASRSVGDGEEQYYWMVKTTVEGGATKEVNLSNNNLGGVANRKYALSEGTLSTVKEIWESSIRLAKQGERMDWEKLIYRTAFPKDTEDAPIPDDLDVPEEELLSDR